jgi:hypothetical protein
MRTYNENINADFTCKQCGALVSANHGLSGVVNRNHCPYCLHSRHLDLFEAGDRLSACKELMVPAGLTLKKSRDKYAKNAQGELMLVHFCEGCNRISINRIAADDDPVKVLEIFERNLENQTIVTRCEGEDICLLQSSDRWLVQARLYGSKAMEKQQDSRICMSV